MTVDFGVAGLAVTAINGGSQFSFTPAVSFAVPCADHAESDRMWDALIEGGGEPAPCGWLADDPSVVSEHLGHLRRYLEMVLA